MQTEYITDEIFVIKDLLSKKECDSYIDYTENIGYEDAPITTAAGPVMSPGIRNNTRVMFDNKKMAEKLWQRFHTLMPSFENRQPIGLNERFRFYRYDPEQRFKVHSDGFFMRENGEQSVWTFMIYLNDNFEGGETRFFIQNEKINIKPEVGMALFFVHDLLHEGCTVLSGRKYVLRSDVMYTA